MPTSLNAMLLAWAITITLLASVGTWAELTYDSTDSDQQHGAEATDPDTNNSDTDTGDANTQRTNDPDASNANPSGPSPSNPAGDDTPEATQSVIRLDDNPDILEDTAQGLIPRQGRNGTFAAEYYAAPHPATTEARPRIALIMMDLGLKTRITQRALAETPVPVTFALSAYGSGLQTWSREARQKGHELLLMVPMEPLNADRNDAGPLALLTTKNERENIGLLRTSLGKFTGYVGIINMMGDKFTANADTMRPVLQEIKRRGLMFVDARTSRYSSAATLARNIRLPVAMNNAVIDATLRKEAIDNALLALENRARTLGTAVGVMHPYPISIAAVKDWVASLPEKGFILVPVTAVADRQPIR